MRLFKVVFDTYIYLPYLKVVSASPPQGNILTLPVPSLLVPTPDAKGGGGGGGSDCSYELEIL